MLIFIPLQIWELTHLVWKVPRQRLVVKHSYLPHISSHSFVNSLVAMPHSSHWEKYSWWYTLQTFMEHLLYTKLVCIHVYGHKWSCYARIEEAIVTVVKHDDKTFWHSSYWKVRSVSPCIWVGLWLFGPVEYMGWCFMTFKVSKAGSVKAMVTVTQSSWLVPLLWGTSAAMKEFQLLWHCHAGEAIGRLSDGQLQWTAQPTATVSHLPRRWAMLGGQPRGAFWRCSTHTLVNITIRNPKGALPKFLTH